jgi:hypothetical protein
MRIRRVAIVVAVRAKRTAAISHNIAISYSILESRQKNDHETCGSTLFLGALAR